MTTSCKQESRRISLWLVVFFLLWYTSNFAGYWPQTCHPRVLASCEP